MHVDFLLERFRAARDKDAMAWRGKIYTYDYLLRIYEETLAALQQNIHEPIVVSIEGDFSPRSTALLLALIELDCSIVPLAAEVAHQADKYKEIAEVEASILLREDDSFVFQKENRKASHELLIRLKNEHHPGFVFFSSGSTGKSKAAVHDVLPLLEKFKVVRQCMRILTFLLFDHMGGINTLLYVLSNTGCIVMTSSRRPDVVCRNIETYKVEVLPTSPTFINLLLVGETYRNYDLSSLKMVTYGTEPMPESTLKRFHELFPAVRLLQTYGLTEIGVMRSKSQASDSLWVKIGGEDFQTRVVDGLLEIKAKSAMLGYLNAPSPFTADGWFKTGDEVLVNGEYFRILGRRSEMINVGGQKVFPAEVESVIQEMDGVEEVAVCGEQNLLIGQIVKAKVKLLRPESLASFRQRLRSFCKERLESYKIPQKVELVDYPMYGERFKKKRIMEADK